MNTAHGTAMLKSIYCRATPLICNKLLQSLVRARWHPNVLKRHRFQANQQLD
ncbi:hypothetical protein ACQ4WP_23630 [Janthinobacterium sp. GB4P2]|uniref:hypothetical protein n=1 Tax=Janthinobacterium sp. GB4P2 TaxID=3424189 RepID=UPI003F24632E